MSRGTTMLKGAFTVGLLGLTIGLISFGISYTRSPREPTVDVPAVIDLGVQAKGRHVETGFLIRNRGMEALVLRNFGTTCGCVRPFRRRAAGQTEVVEEVVPPLSEIEIHVGAAIRGDKGDFEHWVRFDTNDPGRPHVEIALIGKVDIGVYTTPSQLHLGRLHPGQEVQQTVHVVDCRTQDLELRCKSSPAHPSFTSKDQRLPITRKTEMVSARATTCTSCGYPSSSPMLTATSTTTCVFRTTPVTFLSRFQWQAVSSASFPLAHPRCC